MDGERKPGRAPPNRSSGINNREMTVRAAKGDAPWRLIILSDIRFLREGLGEVLGRDGCFAVAGLASDIDEALAMARGTPPQIVLIDAALRDGFDAAARLHKLAPTAQIVALGLSETEEEVIAWAEAGVGGYVPRSTALGKLVEFLEQILHGEQVCSNRIAASLLRRIAEGLPQEGAKPDKKDAATLTRREEQVMRLVGAGLSNKEIARDLDIGVATIKSHVHNVLGKLVLTRRSQIAHWLSLHESNTPEWRQPPGAATEPGTKRDFARSHTY